jgi:hypothetical protein
LGLGAFPSAFGFQISAFKFKPFQVKLGQFKGTTSLFAALTIYFLQHFLGMGAQLGFDIRQSQRLKRASRSLSIFSP